jgi:hypothetical protein
MSPTAMRALLPKSQKRATTSEERRASNSQFVEEMVQALSTTRQAPMDDHTLATSIELQEAIRDARLWWHARRRCDRGNH